MLWPTLLLPTLVAASLPIKLEIKRTLDSGLANIHVTYTASIRSEIIFNYGSCGAQTPGEAHHSIARTIDRRHDRLVWLIPADAASGGCLSAWDQHQNLLGRSESLSLVPPLRTARRRLRKRQEDVGIRMDNSSGIDAGGPWFDGVAALTGKELAAVDTAAAKSKEIAIVGAGMAGLMTWMALNDSGMTNITIIEAAQRLGGRVHTAYFGDPSERQYQEMGPMRIPVSIQYSSANETLQIQDHKLVFDLADEVNRRNGNNPNFTISFIPWLQRSPNGLYAVGGIRLPNGEIPTQADILANPSLVPESVIDPVTAAAEDAVSAIFNNRTFIEEIARNMFRAHKSFLDTGLNGLGGDDWSEFAYLHNYLAYPLNTTLVVVRSAGGRSFWDTLFESVYFAATTWRTIDGGLSRLPSAFHPLVDDITHMDRKVQRVSYNQSTKRVTLQWKTKPLDRTFQNASYDYAIVTAPMALVRTWRLPAFSPLLSTAIDTYEYDQVCKVALQFQTRFWEQFEQPIYGSCSTITDIPGIGSICYPPYDINSTGPGVMLASYTGSDDGLRWASVPEEEHVQYVVDAMAEIHGDVVYEQYTGRYNRRCWILDEYETVSWAAAQIGMRKAFIPAFFQVEQGVIMSGEGTSYTSSWISSALESGIRASVQLLLELGLVDEAKAVTEKWMARWISV